jgi:hypothetical protein
MAARVHRERIGNQKGRDFAKRRKDLEAIPGIEPETANI